MEADTYSVSSARPSSNTNPGSNTPNPMAKKSGFRRLSWRRLFYAGGPLLQVRPRGLGKGGRGVGDEGAHSETNLREPHHGNGFGASRKGSIRFATASGGQSSSDGKDVRGPVVKSTERGDCYECPLCLNVQTVDHFPEMLTCPHRSCQDCLRQYLRIEIAESRINICCPECTEPLHPTDIRHILNDELFMAKYEEFMLRRVLATEPDARWCPAPDCSFAVIASGCASCPKIKCERPGCQTFFCYHCKQEWHPNQTCDAARAQRYPNVHSSSVSFSQDSAQRDDIKPCPSCQVLIIKMDDGSCNHMTCAVCDAEFCWLCMKEISDLHYLSPSGCTFWGKKPWSRKKKILWQLGTLVGAPVGISLVAGIAVPAIIIGIPVWVGRKLHTRYETSSKHKRNLAITGGVTASILISPVLAGLAVGIGVPILLAYVYGVVPISLCRSGGCGVTTSASGVRIEFDENEMAGVAGGQATVDAQSVDTGSHQVANPSIGEMSFGMSASLSMGSGSHLERIGLVRDSDRESASNTAIAGASLTGSVSSSTVGGPAGHRLEVHADVASDKRFSFSSETTSATVSLSDRSATMSFVDDASMRALAGSIVGCRDTMPVEVHVDIASSALTDPSIETAVKASTAECDATPSVPPVACPTTCGADETTSTRSWRSQRGKQKLSAMEKQANVNPENGSVWSAEDTVSVSERVRFDENVSFIDDFLSSEEAQGALPPLSTDQWRPARRVGSASGCREESWKPSGQTETWERAQSWQGVCEEAGMVWDRRAREVPVLAAWNKLVSENGEAVESVSVASSSMSSSSASGSSASATTMENVTPLHRIATLEDCEADGNANPNPNCNPNRASALCRSASGVAGFPVTPDSVTLTGFTGDETDDYGAGASGGGCEGEVEEELTVVCHGCSVRSSSDS